MRSHWLFLSCLIFACSAPEETEQNVFVYNESNGITSLDPAFARNLENMWAVNQVFDGLVELDDQIEITPSIAQRWEISPDGKSYTFHLRTDVYFHDDPCFENGRGRRVEARDVVYSFERLMDEQLASPGRWICDPLGTPGCLATNDSTVVFQLKSPFPPFLGLLTTPYGSIVPHEAVSKYGDEFRSHPVGSGPFKIGFWLEDVALILHKNPHYFLFDEEGIRLPYLDAVKIEFVRDMNSEFLGLLQGRYDFMSGIHPAYKDELLTPQGELQEAYSDVLRLSKKPFLKTDYIGILVDDSLPLSTQHPLHDKRVRQALNYSIDRRAMVKYLRNNSVFDGVFGYVPPGMPGFSDVDTLVTYDLEKAKSLLADAGYPDGKGIPVVAISTTSDYTDLMEFLQHQWAKIGFEVEVEVLSGPGHREKVSSSSALMFRKSWLADYADAENFLSNFTLWNHCPDGANYTHFYYRPFDSLYVQAQQMPDDSSRYAVYRRMNEMLAEEVPVIPLFYDQVTHFIRKEVQGLPTNAVNMLDLTRTKKAVK